jgi:hypothetical protein
MFGNYKKLLINVGLQTEMSQQRRNTKMTDEDLKIFADDILDFLNGLEASCVKLRKQIEKLWGAEKPAWDAAKIKWSQEAGVKGPFEKSEDVDSPDFKNLVKDLKAHGGKLYQDGWFMWLYKNGATVGRKLKGKAKAPASQDDAQNIAEKFPEDLRGILSFECQADAIIIKPRQFLGSENFAKIATIVKQLKGDYISAGKQSHFRIPLKK